MLSSKRLRQCKSLGNIFLFWSSWKNKHEGAVLGLNIWIDVLSSTRRVSCCWRQQGKLRVWSLKAEIRTTEVCSGSEHELQWNLFFFFFLFAYAECLHWHSHRQRLKLGFSDNVNKATERDYSRTPAAGCWALTDLSPFGLFQLFSCPLSNSFP